MICVYPANKLYYTTGNDKRQIIFFGKNYFGISLILPNGIKVCPEGISFILPNGTRAPEGIKVCVRNQMETAAYDKGKMFLMEFMMECRGIIHVVREGDTLYLLSRKYHVPLLQIMYANPFVDIYNLQIGDELCIPVSLRDEALK